MNNKIFPVLLVFLLIVTSACSYSKQTQTVEEDMTPEKEFIQPTVELIPSSTEIMEPILQNNCEDLNNEENQVAMSAAETYELSYEQIITWFCYGYSFENILVALETSTAVDISPDKLLEMTKENNWDEIWKEIGFVK